MDLIEPLNLLSKVCVIILCIPFQIDTQDTDDGDLPLLLHVIMSHTHLHIRFDPRRLTPVLLANACKRFPSPLLSTTYFETAQSAVTAVAAVSKHSSIIEEHLHKTLCSRCETRYARDNLQLCTLCLKGRTFQLLEL